MTGNSPAPPSDARASDLDGVVAKAYAAIAEPQSFVTLIGELIEADEKLGGIGESADLHFRNAEAILDKMYPLGEADYSTLRTHLETDLECDLALDAGLKVVSFNPRVFEGGDVARKAAAPDWLFDPVTGSSDRERLHAAKLDDGERVFLRLYTREGDDAGRWFSARSVAVGTERITVLHVVRLRWDEASGTMFQQAMDLTNTELALTRHLVTGGKVREFAELRGRAIGTVRNQLKTLQRKLVIGSKEELLLLYAGFIHSLDPSPEDETTREHICTTIFTGPDGGTIGWEEFGAPDGKPVLFFHPLEGALFTPAMEVAARRAGLRIVAPWRPHYGDTSGGKPGRRTPEEFAGRLPSLLDHLGIERCAALATHAGTPYMAAFAQAAPGRLLGAVTAGPFFPVRDAEDFQFLQKGMGAQVRMVRVAPAFARVYMRALLASMGTGEFYRFVEEFYQDCPRELGVMQSPEMVELFRKTARYVLPRGSDGPVDTMMNWANEWSAYLADLALPMRMLVGEEDSNTPPAFAAISCERYGLGEPQIVAGAGSFLLHDAPDLVFETVARLFDPAQAD